MSQVVQSTCPRCKKLLRIPGDWLHQPIRCKHCGMILQAKRSPTTSRTASAPTPRQEQDTTDKPAAPLAVPIAAGVTSAPFADVRGEEEQPPPTRRRRSRSGGRWKGPVLILAVFVLAGFAVYFNWERLAALLPPDDNPTVGNRRDNGAVTPREAGPRGQGVPRRSLGTRKRRVAGNLFPRRALLISVHDYLYANPIHDGMRDPQAHNLNNLINSLNLGLHIPLNQIAHLSDAATAKYKPRAPTKNVIEKTLTRFLDTSRPQDRIVVFFIGHSTELDDEVYLAPIEGELDRAETLIPLKWFYEQIAKCKAQQKVLVLDVNRYHRAFGQERPGGEPMGPKLDALLKKPPPGVQVWSSCIAEQRSYATDDFPMGIFLDSLLRALRQGGNGKIQKVEDALPIEHYVPVVNKFIKDDLSKRKLEQVSRLTGKEAEDGAAYDANQSPPPDAVTCLAPPPAGVERNKALIESVLKQIGTPPIKVTHELALRYDALPPFAEEALKQFEGGQVKADSPLRKAVENARAVLWAIYPGEEPQDLRGEVSQLRKDIGVQLTVLKEGYRKPAGGKAENQFKERVANDERQVALLIRAIEDALDKLESPAVAEMRDKASKRWQANYDFIKARMQLEFAYLFEYQSMLGSMRKEFPPLDPELHGGWKLASQARMRGDITGKREYRHAKKLLDKIIEDNAGSPWEVLAKREKLTNLGLDWQPTR